MSRVLGFSLGRERIFKNFGAKKAKSNPTNNLVSRSLSPSVNESLIRHEDVYIPHMPVRASLCDISRRRSRGRVTSRTWT